MAMFTLAFSSQLLAQETPSRERTKISVEIDPSTFVFKGYGIHLRIQPKSCDHLLVGIGTYAMDMPDALVDFNKRNKNSGWNIRINQAYGLFGEYHFTQVNRKWFLGTQIGIQEFKIQNSDFDGSEKFTNLLAMGYFGYTMKPFENTFYIKPWAGLAYTSKIAGKNILESAVYDVAPITYFATLHLGYTF